MRTKKQDLDKVKAYQKRLRDSGICLKCKGKSREGKATCLSCQEKENLRLRKWKIDHPDKVKASSKEYYNKNYERERKRTKQWAIDNKDRMTELRKAGKHNYRNRKKIAGRFSLIEWKNVLSFYNYKCLWCENTDVEITIDHVVPLVKGGTNDIKNLQPLCRVCNSKKHDKIIDFRPFGSAILEWT